MISNPFADLAPSPQEHFKLHFYEAVLYLIHQVSGVYGSLEVAFHQHPFLSGYHEELSGRGAVDGPEGLEWWRAARGAWEDSVPGHLPLRALRRAAGLDESMLRLLIGIGLSEEDSRFGALFEKVQGVPGQHRPTLGFLNACWQEPGDSGDIRGSVRRLVELGLIQVVNLDAPRIQRAFEPPGSVWDAIRGDVIESPAPWLYHRPASSLTATEELIFPDSVLGPLGAIRELLADGRAPALIVRGPRHNGRTTLLGSLARSLGLGQLVVSGPARPDDDRWRGVGPLATLLGAMPTIVLEPAPGEAIELPRISGYSGPLGIVLNRQGGVAGPGVEGALTLSLEAPDPETRARHWRACLGDDLPAGPGPFASRFRMTGGNIRRAARLARSHALLAGRSFVEVGDVQEASRALNRQALDTLASRVETSGDWGHLALSAESMRDLTELEHRCRHRERLRGAVGVALGWQLNPGVRALFTGPSGTGKTLAARLVAASLQMDLYRLDLSSVVNKYIGETEKNLNQIFAHAEELDVILLLDEGDALLTRRTSVQTSVDRYANLETNFLLQRLEVFEGILIITTNASDRIDDAFRRRMDVVINLSPPEAAERWAIWQMHLPAEHAIDRQLLGEVAGRCVLSGGQIRNAVLHATLLALGDGKPLGPGHLEEAVRREYLKAGAVCPIRSSSPKGRDSFDPLVLIPGNGPISR